MTFCVRRSEPPRSDGKWQRPRRRATRLDEIGKPPAREKHLDALAGKEPALWRQVASLIASKQPKAYDQAIALLVDLRDLAARKGGGHFDRRVETLRAEHARKSTLTRRLDAAGLTSSPYGPAIADKHQA